MKPIALALLALAALAAVPLAAAVPPPPPTAVRPVTETVDGIRIVDDYRWLEGDDSDPKAMGAMTPEVAAWTDAQNAYTRSILDHLPGRKALEDALRPLMEVGAVSAPVMRGDRYFYFEARGRPEPGLALPADGQAGTPRLLLDPAKLDASGLTTIAWMRPIADGKLLAYGTYRAGDENSTLHLLDVDADRTEPLTIADKTIGVDWLPDASGFVYRNLANVEDPYSGQVLFHRMGTDVAADRLVIRQYTDGRERQARPHVRPLRQPLPRRPLAPPGLLDRHRPANDVWVADLGPFLAGGELERGPVVVGGEGRPAAPSTATRSSWRPTNGRPERGGRRRRPRTTRALRTGSDAGPRAQGRA